MMLEAELELKVSLAYDRTIAHRGPDPAWAELGPRDREEVIAFARELLRDSESVWNTAVQAAAMVRHVAELLDPIYRTELRRTELRSPAPVYDEKTGRTWEYAPGQCPQCRRQWEGGRDTTVCGECVLENLSGAQASKKEP